MKPTDRRALTAAALSTVLLVPLLVFGAPALARTAASAHEYGSQYQYRLKVCHRTHSKKHPWHWITVSQSALKAHLKHGDFSGPTCPPPAAQPGTTTTTTTTTTPPTRPGKSHGKGHGGGGDDGQGDNGHGNGNGNGHHK